MNLVSIVVLQMHAYGSYESQKNYFLGCSSYWKPCDISQDILNNQYTDWMYDTKTCSLNSDAFRYVCSKPDPGLCAIGDSYNTTNPLRAVLWGSDPNDEQERPRYKGIKPIAQVRCVYDLKLINTVYQIERLKTIIKPTSQNNYSALMKLICENDLYGRVNKKDDEVLSEINQYCSNKGKRLIDLRLFYRVHPDLDLITKLDNSMRLLF